MEQLSAIHFAGTDFLLSPEDVTPEVREYVEGCCPPGMDAEPFIAEAMARVGVTGDTEDCKAYLRGYGAWDEEELASHEDNLMRLLWLTAGAWADGGEAYFSTY